MGLLENDPRDTGYIALYIAIKWYQDISSDAAIRIAEGKSNAKPGVKLTPEIFEQIKKVMQSPNFTNINGVVRRFRVNKYEIYKAIAKERFNDNTADEGVITISQIDVLLKRLKDKAEGCSGANCDKCYLDTLRDDGTTLCEMLCDLEFDEKCRPIKRNVRKSPHLSTKEYLIGDTTRKTFRIYDEVLKEMDKYIESRPQEKIQDIVSTALIRYIGRRS
jgi:hypothetical protein